MKQRRYKAVDEMRKETGETDQQRKEYVRFEVFTAVTMKNVVFWDIKT
jgi:hypothetical protein